VYEKGVMDPLVFAYEFSVSNGHTRSTTRVQGPGPDAHLKLLVALVCVVALMMGLFLCVHRGSRSKLRQGDIRETTVPTNDV
jgi:hypothetical protein